MPFFIPYANLLSQAASYLANFLLTIGESAASIYSSIESHFPGMSPTAQAAAVQLGSAMRFSQTEFDRLGYDRPVRIRSIPIDPALSVPFRTIVNVEFTDPNTGAMYYRTLVIDTNRSPTKSELLEQSASVIAELMDLSGKYGEIPAAAIPYIRIVGIRGITRSS